MRVAADDWGKLERLHLGQWGPAGPRCVLLPECLARLAGVMKIPLLQGRDFRASDTLPGSAIVNETFARQYFGGENPVGRSFEVVRNRGSRTLQIVGLVGDARYRDMREPMRPTAYFPFQGEL